MEGKSISEFGKDFENKTLDEDTLKCDVSVVYENEEYKTGNRRGHLAEIFKNGKFHKTIHTKFLRLIK